MDDPIWILPTTGMFNIDRRPDGVEIIEHSTDGGRTWKMQYISAPPELVSGRLAKERAEREAKQAAREKREAEKKKGS